MQFKSKNAEKQFVENMQNQSSPYGVRIFTYAREWADLMELKMKSGFKLTDIAEETSNIANTDGITGFMYGASVSVLSQYWKFGGLLQNWHNLDCQIGDEGRVANNLGKTLNPALLCIQDE